MHEDFLASINRRRSIQISLQPSRRNSNRLPSSPSRRLEVPEPRTLLHANPVLDAEHLAVFGARDATTGIVTGDWSPIRPNGDSLLRRTTDNRQ
jgi:hypothetical protein